MARLWQVGLSSVIHARGSIYGKGPGMLLASADDTAPKTAAIAETAASVMDRIFLNSRLGIPGSFRCQGADSARTVCPE